jgi:hypothetical protein
MAFLWIVLAIVYIACWIYFGLTTFSQGPLLAVLDWLPDSDPVDRERVHRADRSRGGSSRRGVMAVTRAGGSQPVNVRGERRGASAANSAASL